MALGLGADWSPMAAGKRRIIEEGFMNVFRKFANSITQVIEPQFLNAALADGFRIPKFADETVMRLAGKYQLNGVIGFPQFSCMLDYLVNAKDVFDQIDADHNGYLDVMELMRAFQLSGFQEITQDIAQEIGQSYDDNKNGRLEFDEFVQMRIEWDFYMQAWNEAMGAMPLGQAQGLMRPDMLLQILEKIKTSLEPLVTLIPMFGQQIGATAWLHNSMFRQSSPFQLKTLEMLILRFSQGNMCININQFCLMMEFIKGIKYKFSQVDVNKDGHLDVGELQQMFIFFLNIQVGPGEMTQIFQRYDTDGSGRIEFDEFVQLMTEWSEMSRYNRYCSSGDVLTAQDLQRLLGEVRMVYHSWYGSMAQARPWHIKTCRWLVAKFGTPQPGQKFAQFVNGLESFRLVAYIKQSAFVFNSFSSNFSGDSGLQLQDLFNAFTQSGLCLTTQIMENIGLCYDASHSGSLQFDEFLQMLLEVEHYHTQFQNFVNPVTRQATLDENAFFSLLFSVPRDAVLE